MKTHSLKTLLPLILIILGINACSDGSGGTGSIGDKQPPVSPTPVSPKPVEPTDPGLVDLDDFNGIYFNPETKQVALIDMDEDYKVFIHNYGKSNTYLFVSDDVTAGETSATSDSSTYWQFLRGNGYSSQDETLELSADKNTLTVSLLPDADDTSQLERQPDSLEFADFWVYQKRDENTTTWTINKDGSFIINLRGKCDFTGTLEDSGKGYYIDTDAQLTTGCETVAGLSGYKPGEYTTKLFTFTTKIDGDEYTYVATESVLNGADITMDRPIWSVLAVRTPVQPVDGIYYVNRPGLKDIGGMDCDYNIENEPYCTADEALTDGTYGQIAFIDTDPDRQYNVVIHKAISGAPGLPLNNIIFFNADGATFTRNTEGKIIGISKSNADYYIGQTSAPPSLKEGNIDIKLNFDTTSGNQKEVGLSVKISGSALFDPANTTYGNVEDPSVMDPTNGVIFHRQQPFFITDILLNSVPDRSELVWFLDNPTSTGTPFSARDTCSDTINSIEGRVTSEKGYYFSDTKVTFSALGPVITNAMTIQMYGFKAQEDGETFLSTSVVSNDVNAVPLALAGGLSTDAPECP